MSIFGENLPVAEMNQTRAMWRLQTLTGFISLIRLWPPFFGGLRVTQTDLHLGDFHVPQGYGIFYSNYFAHRDPTIFSNPEEFMPERWKGANKDDTGIY